MRTCSPETRRAPGPRARATSPGCSETSPRSPRVSAPSVPSLARLRPGYFASAYAFWGVENREAALRYVPSSPLLGAAHANVELKPSDASANPVSGPGRPDRRRPGWRSRRGWSLPDAGRAGSGAVDRRGARACRDRRALPATPEAAGTSACSPARASARRSGRADPGCIPRRPARGRGVGGGARARRDHQSSLVALLTVDRNRARWKHRHCGFSRFIRPVTEPRVRCRYDRIRQERLPAHRGRNQRIP